MKKSILLIATAFVVLTGCDKIKELTEINKDFNYTGTVEIPEIPNLPTGDTLPPGGLTTDLPAIALPTNSDQYISNANTAANMITHVKLKAFSAEVKEPSGAMFNFMDTIRIYISADSLPQQLVAYKYGIPGTSAKVDLTCNDINLKEYFLKDTMYIKMNGHFVKLPSPQTKVDLNSTFNMLANPLN